jgi:cytochrome c
MVRVGDARAAVIHPGPAVNDIPVVIIAIVLAMAAFAVRADGSADLAEARGCMSCHDVDQANVGPAFRTIANKYANDADAPARIAAKLRSGDGHVKPHGSEQDVDDLVAYVLSLH